MAADAQRHDAYCQRQGLGSKRISHSFKSDAPLFECLQMHENVKHTVLGQTLDGRNMDLLQVGQDTEGQPRKSRIWVIARQHPGACVCVCVCVHAYVCASVRLCVGCMGGRGGSMRHRKCI